MSNTMKPVKDQDDFIRLGLSEGDKFQLKTPSDGVDTVELRHIWPYMAYFMISGKTKEILYDNLKEYQYRLNDTDDWKAFEISTKYDGFTERKGFTEDIDKSYLTDKPLLQVELNTLGQTVQFRCYKETAPCKRTNYHIFAYGCYTGFGYENGEMYVSVFNKRYYMRDLKRCCEYRILDDRTNKWSQWVDFE